MNKILTAAFIVIYCTYSYAQSERIRLFIDCSDCDTDYIKRNLTWIDYVRDPNVADLHLWITDQRTGSGNTEYIFNFETTSSDHDSINNVTYYADARSTELELQEDFVNIIRASLLPALIRRGIIPDISVKPGYSERIESTDIQDPWNYWIFGIDVYIDFFREQQRKDYEFNGELEADRITTEWRFRSELDYEFERNEVKNNDSKIISYLNRIDLQASLVKSLSAHTSTGVFSNAYRNSINNIDAGGGMSGAFEYNVYPYEESHIREFTFAYYLGFTYLNYTEETIFNKLKEQKPVHQLIFNYRLNQSWGGIDAELEGLQYLDQIKQKRLILDLELFIRIIRGLAINLNTEAQLVNDQIYLPKGDASFEDTLLRRKALATDYIFEFRFGFSYTFGSLYNNIVNTRL